MYNGLIRWIIAAGILFAVYSPIAKADESGFRFNRDRSSVNIPIKVSNNLAVIPLKINGFGPLHFILDTGVSTTILTEPVIMNFLDIEIDDTVLLYGLGGKGIVEGGITYNVTISMRGITGHNKNMIIVPEDVMPLSEVFGFPIFGILGYDFFKHFPMRIDYSNESLRVYQDNNYRITRRSEVLPIKLVNGKPYVESSIIGASGDTLSTHLLLDLGASHAMYLNQEYINMSAQTLPGFLGQGISGNLRGKIGRVEKLILGGVEIDQPLVLYPDAEFLRFHGRDLDWEGIIGGAIMTRYVLFLDYPREKIILRPGAGRSRPFNTSLTGMEVVARGESLQKFIIHYVRPGSTGYEAGIWAGDRIINLNGVPYTQLSFDDVLNAFTGRKGDVINMLLKRDDYIFRVSVTLREDLLY